MTRENDRIISMTEYIRATKTEIIFSELREEILGGLKSLELARALCRNQAGMTGRTNGEKITAIYYGMDTRDTVIGTMILELGVEIEYGKDEARVREWVPCKYRGTVLITFGEDITFEFSDYRFTRYEPPLWAPVSEYMIPYASFNDIQEHEEDYIASRFPGCLSDVRLIDPTVLAERLGLSIVRLPLTHEKTKSILDNLNHSH